MKKGLLLIILLSVFFISACDSTNKEEELLNHYVEAFTKGDLNELKKALPNVWIENYNQDALDSSVRSFKSLYGDDYTITYEIKSKEKLDSSDYKEMQDLIKSYYDVDMTDCHSMNVMFVYSGSKKTEKQEMNINYCKFDGKWYLSM